MQTRVQGNILFFISGHGRKITNYGYISGTIACHFIYYNTICKGNEGCLIRPQIIHLSELLKLADGRWRMPCNYIPFLWRHRKVLTHRDWVTQIRASRLWHNLFRSLLVSHRAKDSHSKQWWHVDLQKYTMPFCVKKGDGCEYCQGTSNDFH